MYGGETAIGFLFGLVFGLAIGGTIGAVVLRAAASWAEGIDIPFGSAFATAVIAGFVNALIGGVAGFAYGLATAAPGQPPNLLPLQIVLFPVGILVQSAVISQRHSLTFGKGFKISLFMLLIAIIIGIVVAAVVFGVMALMFGLRRH